MMIQEIKLLVYTLVSGVLALLMPIKDFMTAMVILFAMNYVFGLTADVVQGSRWSMKKSMVFFYHCLLFFSLSAVVFVIGHFMHNERGAVQCVSLLCYTAIWFYATNILRNLRSIMIEEGTMWRVVDFAYYVVSLKAVEKIPYLSDYIKKKGDKDE